MHAERRVNAFERSVLNHVESADSDLLGGLEEDLHRAPELMPVRGEDLRRGEQHRDVVIVPAGVHDARVLAREGKSRRLRDRERVDIGPEEDRFSGQIALDRAKRPLGEALSAAPPLDSVSVELRAEVFSSFPLSSGCA